VAVTLLRQDRVLLRDHLPHHHREDIMDWTLEVVILPVSDIDRAVAFYRDKVGFELDHDTKNEHMHVVQLTPRGPAARSSSATCPVRTRCSPVR
jgi:hypothetical protein